MVARVTIGQTHRSFDGLIFIPIYIHTHTPSHSFTIYKTREMSLSPNEVYSGLLAHARGTRLCTAAGLTYAAEIVPQLLDLIEEHRYEITEFYRCADVSIALDAFFAGGYNEGRVLVMLALAYYGLTTYHREAVYHAFRTYGEVSGVDEWVFDNGGWEAIGRFVTPEKPGSSSSCTIA